MGIYRCQLFKNLFIYSFFLRVNEASSSSPVMSSAGQTMACRVAFASLIFLRECFVPFLGINIFFKRFVPFWSCSKRGEVLCRLFFWYFKKICPFWELLQTWPDIKLVRFTRQGCALPKWRRTWPALHRFSRGVNSERPIMESAAPSKLNYHNSPLEESGVEHGSPAV